MLPIFESGKNMETVFDWLTLAVFGGLVVLFLQRSMEEEPADNLLHYAPPAIGCAFANWLGNSGHEVFAIAALALCVAYTLVVLKPFSFTR